MCVCMCVCVCVCGGGGGVGLTDFLITFFDYQIVVPNDGYLGGRGCQHFAFF